MDQCGVVHRHNLVYKIIFVKILDSLNKHVLCQAKMHQNILLTKIIILLQTSKYVNNEFNLNKILLFV